MTSLRSCQRFLLQSYNGSGCSHIEAIREETHNINRGHPTDFTIKVSFNASRILQESLHHMRTLGDNKTQQASGMALIEIATKTEFDELLQSHPYVAVQAFATWCGPCRAITPFFCANAKRYDHVSEKYAFVRFDTDEVPELAQELGIRSVPCFFAFENGEKTDDLSGANPPALQKLLDRMGEKVDSLAAANPLDAQSIRDQIGGQAGHTREEDTFAW